MVMGAKDRKKELSDVKPVDNRETSKQETNGNS
jgi:hypothetical protein